MPVMTLLDRNIKEYEKRNNCALEVISRGTSGSCHGNESPAVAFKGERSIIAREIRRLGEANSEGTYYIPCAVVIRGDKTRKGGMYADYAICRKHFDK